MQNYTIYHLHSDLSNGVTNIDSVTKFQSYIDKAKECGMKAIAFSEHGSVFKWFAKKEAVEAAGMKYIHAVECYLTASLDEKIRDNYHCVLLSKNYSGFLELNRLVSKSFSRKDNHFYYVPRLSFDELFSTSENIIVTSACVGGVLGKGSEADEKAFLDFMVANRNRCFLEIGHHLDPKQCSYNKKLYDLSVKYFIPLIAGTDTHALDDKSVNGRKILQRAKRIVFDDEDLWDLRFKTYEELIEAYRLQGVLPKGVYMQAIENTNALADMIEPFSVSTGTKYPHIYENPEEVFREKIDRAIDNHPYALKNHSREEICKRVEEEFAAYKATESIDFMLLQTYLREWEKENGIQCGYGRGSVSGSMIAYLLGITQMDSMRYDLNFFRFINPSRVTCADIDTDYSSEDRDRVKEFLLKHRLNLPNIKTAEIITFNTIALKGAIRDVGRALEIPLAEVSEICKACSTDVAPDEMRAKYSELFDYVDIVIGTIVSVGTHPSGVLVSDLPIDDIVGTCSMSSSDYPVSMLNMKELDAQMFVKLDVLSLDNIGVINDTCKALGIERLTPDNTDLTDMSVWRDIREDTTLIFQWESNSAQAYLRKFMSEATIERAQERAKNFSMLKWLSFGNGLIRPACASFRDSVARGEFYDNGFKELNDFLSQEAGRIAMQETIMKFLVRFCGYTDAESDSVRRAIAKKKGTESLLPEIEARFVDFSSEHYNISKEECKRVIEPFIQVLLDASAYAFSWNHSDAYSATGYICGYLRHYYPYEFLTAALNIFSDDTEKTSAITKYAQRHNIRVSMPKWGVSTDKYAFDKERGLITKSLTAIKHMSAGVARELYELSKSREYTDFTQVLLDINKNTSLNTGQLDILIKLDYFSDFGNQRELLRISDMFLGLFKKGNAKKIDKKRVDGTPIGEIIKKYAVGVTKQGGEAKSYTLLDIGSILHEAEQKIKAIHLEDLSDIVKVKNFADAMGYVGYTSGKEEDRRKLYIIDIKPLVRKKDNVQFGYSFITKSIGSGKESRFTVVNSLYTREPVNKGDIIYCEAFERQGQYFRLNAYSKLM